MTPDTDRRKRNIIIICLAVVIVGAGFLIFKSNNTGTPRSATGPTTVYHDPVSGENIVNQEGKATEGQSSSSTTPTYAGFDKLLEVGFTLNQLDSAYSAFEQYQPFASNKVQISLAVNDVSTVRPNDADPLYRWSVVSHIVVNRTDSYKVQIYYWGENSAELVLLNADGSQQLFDSGPLNTSDTPDID